MRSFLIVFILISAMACKPNKSQSSKIASGDLNGNWVLFSLNGDKANVENFRERLPFINIDTKEKKFTGFGGCNQIFGQIISEKGLLSFSNIAQSKMLCAPPNKEGEFLKALQSTTNFEINNDQLILSNPDKKIMVFQKAD